MSASSPTAAGVRQRAVAAQRRDAQMAQARERREVTLLDLLDRLLDGGVVIHGDIVLAVADVDLVYVGLRAIVASVESMRERGLPSAATSRGWSP